MAICFAYFSYFQCLNACIFRLFEVHEHSQSTHMSSFFDADDDFSLPIPSASHMTARLSIATASNLYFNICAEIVLTIRCSMRRSSVVSERIGIRKDPKVKPLNRLRSFPNRLPREVSWSGIRLLVHHQTSPLVHNPRLWPRRSFVIS